VGEITSEDLVQQTLTLATDKKALRPVILDLREVSIVTDYFLIVSAQSRVQTLAIADHIQKEVTRGQVQVISREGDIDGKWILLDCGPVIVHVFQEDTREFYSLERLWAEANEYCNVLCIFSTASTDYT